MAKDERIRFPSGSYQALHKGICYRIDPENDVVEMTQKLKFKYNPESEEEALNLVNRLGAEKTQERLGLFSKLLVISILLFLFLTLLPTFFPGKSENIINAGRFLTVVSEIAFLYKFGYYKIAINYYRDSYCEKCGKYFVFQEYKAPLMKEESGTDAYKKTLTKHWRCRKCGYEDIKIEPQPVDHHHEEKQHSLKEDTCDECGKEHAIEEYRNVDVLNSAARKKIRYFKCRHCGYHEIRLNKKLSVIR